MPRVDHEPPDGAVEAVPPTCAVIGPLLYLTVTIEREGDGEQVHMHPGGQGFWIARMIKVLGCEPRLVSPIGGEAGEVVAALMPGWEIELTAVRTAMRSPTQVQDRRGGDRTDIVGLSIPQIDRHEADDLYGAALEAGLACDAAVLTSAGDGLLPDEAYGRLTHDIAGTGMPVLADLHGGALEAALKVGKITMLKVSEEDLVLDGWELGSEAAVIDAARTLADCGAGSAVVSRGSEAAIAVVEGTAMRVVPPTLAAADHSGAGDSMTAGMTVGTMLGLPPLDAIRLGAAAGAGNVTRRGLGSGRVDLIAELAELVKMEDLS
jgi:1-phosphofructokinase